MLQHLGGCQPVPRSEQGRACDGWSAIRLLEGSAIAKKSFGMRTCLQKHTTVLNSVESVDSETMARESSGTQSSCNNMSLGAVMLPREQDWCIIATGKGAIMPVHCFSPNGVVADTSLLLWAASLQRSKCLGSSKSPCSTHCLFSHLPLEQW